MSEPSRRGRRVIISLAVVAAAVLAAAVVALGAWLTLDNGTDSAESSLPAGCEGDFDGPAALVGFDPATGDEKWVRTLGNEQGVAEQDGLIATLDVHTRVVGTEIATGEVIWCTSVPASSSGDRLPEGLQSVAAAGDIFAVLHQGNVVALEPSSGEERWRVSLSDFEPFASDPSRGIEPAVLVGGDAVFVDRRIGGPQGGIALAFDPETGAVLDPLPPLPLEYTTQNDGLVQAPPETNENATSRLTSINPLTVVDRATGQQRWSRTTPGVPVWNAALTSTTVLALDQVSAGQTDLNARPPVVPTFTQRLTGFDLMTGEQRWQIEFPAEQGWVPEQVFVLDDRAIVASGTVIIAVDPEAGGIESRVDHGSPGVVGPYTEHSRYSFFAADPVTGTLVGFIRAEEPYED